MIMNNKIVSVAGVLAFATFGVLAAGCGGAHLSQLKEAAAADLNCPKNRVHVLTKSGKTRDVEACQQQATYVWDGDDWRMTARGGVAPAGPAPTVMKAGPPGVAPAQPAPVGGPTSTPTGTPSMPPSSPLPPPQPPAPPAAGAKQI